MSDLSAAILDLDPEGYWELNESTNARDDRGTGGATLSVGGHFTLADSNIGPLASGEQHASSFRGSGSGGLSSPDSYAWASTDGSRYAPAQDFSLFARVRPLSFPGGNDLASVINKNGSYGIYLDHNGVPSAYVQDTSGRTVAEATAGLATDDDASVAMTYDGDDVKLYVNGSLVATQSGGPGDITVNGSGFVIGSWDTSGYFLLADIAHVAVFPAVLSAQDMADLHAAA